MKTRFPATACFLVWIALVFIRCTQPGAALEKKGVIKGYKPEKPIDFPHDIHSGQNNIDCSYCHSTDKSGPGKVSPAICANCHQQVVGDTAKTDTLTP